MIRSVLYQNQVDTNSTSSPLKAARGRNSEIELASIRTVRNSGDHSKLEPPGPIPNPEVKRFSADGSGAKGPVRVGRCQVICPDSVNAESGLFCVH